MHFKTNFLCQIQLQMKMNSSIRQPQKWRRPRNETCANKVWYLLGIILLCPTPPPLAVISLLPNVLACVKILVSSVLFSVLPISISWSWLADKDYVNPFHLFDNGTGVVFRSNEICIQKQRVKLQASRSVKAASHVRQAHWLDGCFTALRSPHQLLGLLWVWALPEHDKTKATLTRPEVVWSVGVHPSIMTIILLQILKWYPPTAFG